MMELIKAFAKNRVFANLAMVTILMAGILAGSVMVREDMPEMDLDTIVVTVTYSGADPEEIEEGISRKVEDAIDGLEGVDEYESSSAEGSSVTVITVTGGYDADRLLDRVRNEVDSINTFPDDADSPSIVRPSIQKAVISLGLVSDMDESRLKEWADTIKKEIQRLPGVSQVNMSGTRAYEISIEISQDTLRKYDLAITEVADIITENSLNQFGGTLRTSAEDIRLRTIGRKYTGQELENIKIISGNAGQTVYLKDIAQIKDRFTQDNLSIRANGSPAVLINVLAGEEDTIRIADTVKAFQEKTNNELPEGSQIVILSDNTESTRSNLDTLYTNAAMGLVLVFVLLWLFMDTKVSFWAGMGIPISLLGGLAIVHFAGVSLNKITLFGLIMVLGIVADDAIVVGESIFYHKKNGASAMDAVVKGVSEVGLPVIAAIFTTIVAFLPLYHIDGMMGKFIVALPTAVIACLLISLVECLIMLPAHLSGLPGQHTKSLKKNRISRAVETFHNWTVASMERAAKGIYLPILKTCVRFRYLFASLCVMCLLITAGLIMGGIVKFNVFPKQASSIVVASVEFPEGTPFFVTNKAVAKIEAAAAQAAQTFTTQSGDPLIENVLATVGQGAGETEGHSDSSSPHQGGVRVSLLDPGDSGVHSDDFITAWENACGNIEGVQSLDFSASNSGPPGAPVEICLQGENLDHMSAASDTIMARLNSIDGVSQVYSDNTPGKNELKFHIKPEAEYLGLSLSDLASQIQGAYYGAQALEIQRDNDEVDVYVRLTESERQTRDSIRDFKIKTDEGDWIPLSAIADITFESGYSTITRKNGFRQIMVSAKVDTAKIVAGEVISSLEQEVFKDIRSAYPDIRIILEGDAKRSAESFGSLYIWIPISIMGMFVIIATMFRSYIQPFLILITIPFGLVGAVLGHIVMGHMLSLLSVFGMVALSGVVVNDAIVLIERINMNLEQGMAFFDSIYQGGVRRFRAVMLTSISTVGGLLPLILETSQHARQLIPMGISLAFGVAFATVLTLVLLPCLLTIVNDVRYVFAGGFNREGISRSRLEPAFQRNIHEKYVLPGSPSGEII
ncbi:MAG: efflux RND transporter permease subunit [Desulfobacterales bacterium]|nr:efflux RND transporter permease subunit [Desulfobacterales bacterium]